MKILLALIRRNNKMFFKDKGLFFTSLITPIILLVLYATFLGKVYHDSFLSVMPETISISEKLINGFTGGQLISSLLAVSCVTVAFCSNMLMVQDKISGARMDFTVTPVNRSFLALGYYISSVFSTLLICLFTILIGFLYLVAIGWYLSIADLFLLLLVVFLTILFGTALSSIINYFLSSQGQVSAVGTIVSSGYGFLCGAYMPLSQFGGTLQKILSFLPGTYATSLIRNHTLRGVFIAMEQEGLPKEAVDEIRKAFDCELFFFNRNVTVSHMYLILGSTVLILIGLCIFMNLKKKKHT